MVKADFSSAKDELDKAERRASSHCVHSGEKWTKCLMLSRRNKTTSAWLDAARDQAQCGGCRAPSLVVRSPVCSQESRKNARRLRAPGVHIP